MEASGVCIESSVRSQRKLMLLSGGEGGDRGGSGSFHGESYGSGSCPIEDKSSKPGVRKSSSGFESTSREKQ
eukprot:5510049-Lingulodinium_polyedra.AAC.1